MEFLKKFNFTEDEIIKLTDDIPAVLYDAITSQKKLVETNIDYLVKCGIDNYKEIFILFYDMFLMDSSSFRDIFAKYEKEDLIKFLKKDINIVEYL